ncbi:hypothetical protein D4764_05G0011430 [Takifugu flavidus]|uniref:Gypsy retrotransposon integrase-like protein 1 n=1 Tax=Takifugu flavidus TaxID=433684 RepID=A0A5C6N1E5_9TELE|nr:hypothetical protein D4764_05G0011430 [Takifugu flavidus]
MSNLRGMKSLWKDVQKVQLNHHHLGPLLQLHPIRPNDSAPIKGPYALRPVLDLTDVFGNTSRRPSISPGSPATPSASLRLPASSSDSLRLPAFSSVLQRLPRLLCNLPSPSSSDLFLFPFLGRISPGLWTLGLPHGLLPLDLGLGSELLAVYGALVEWRHWLEGARHPFLVWSDHKNLTYVRTAKRLNPRQGRWALFFSRFDFTLTFRPDSKNIRADALSRQFPEEFPGAPRDPDTIVPPARVIGVISWPIETAVEQAQRDEPDPGNGPQDRMFVPSSVRPQVLEWGHSSCFACHPGVRRTVEFVQRRFWWPNLQEDVREFVGACTVCARSKASHRSPAGLLHPLPVPSRPWSHIALDFVTGLPVSQGNDTILTIVDRFSKGVHFVALPKLPSAAETAELLVSHVVRLHGIPLDVVSDRGPQFTSRVWQAFCKGIGATVSLSSGYHPQSNGQAERANQALEAALRCVTTSNPASWSRFLPWVEYSLNTMESSATGMSPFQCFLGYQPPLFPQQELEIAVPSTRAHLRRCRRIWKTARKAILRATEQSRRSANRRRRPAPAYRPGQKVWLLARDLPLQTSQTSSRKLNPRYIGPYTICSIINPSAVRLDLPAALKVHPVFHVSLIKPFSTSPLSPPALTPPPPQVLSDGEPVWSVNKLLAVRRRGRGFQYLVDWVGYGPEDRSWVPPSYLADPSLLEDFY